MKFTNTINSFIQDVAAEKMTLARGRLFEAASFTRAADPGDWPGLDGGDDLRKLCPRCAGTGLAIRIVDDCPTCGGSGLVW